MILVILWNILPIVLYLFLWLFQEREKEEARVLLEAKRAQEATYAKMTKDIRHAVDLLFSC